MIFAVIFTFAAIILQTIYGYCQEKENICNVSIKKVAPINVTFADKIKRPCSKFINDFFGKIILSIIFALFTVMYIAIAAILYNMEKDDMQMNKYC